MTITVEIKNVYGNELIYPVCDAAKNFAKLAGKKTLTRNTISIIKQMGYSVTVAQKEL